jgi:hypothetical protein
LLGTPWSRISSPRWRTKWVLMVLLPMPLERGEQHRRDASAIAQQTGSSLLVT